MLGGGGDRFGDYLCVDCANLRKWMQSIYKHIIHQTYYQNFEVYSEGSPEKKRKEESEDEHF